MRKQYTDSNEWYDAAEALETEAGCSMKMTMNANWVEREVLSGPLDTVSTVTRIAEWNFNSRTGWIES